MAFLMFAAPYSKISITITSADLASIVCLLIVWRHVCGQTSHTPSSSHGPHCNILSKSFNYLVTVGNGIEYYAFLTNQSSMMARPTKPKSVCPNSHTM